MYMGLTLLFEESSKDLTFLVLAMDDSPIFTSSMPISTSVQDQQKSGEIADNFSRLVQQLEERDTCPPKPTTLERDPRTSKAIEPDAEPAPLIQIMVPTVTNTGSTLLIEGSGYIPLEQVRVELAVNWLSNSPEFKDKSFFQCKTVVTNSSGSFTTTLKLPETSIDTTGIGNYSIIGMESRQEQIRIGAFITSDIKFSSRQ